MAKKDIKGGRVRDVPKEKQEVETVEVKEETETRDDTPKIIVDEAVQI